MTRRALQRLLPVMLVLALVLLPSAAGSSTKAGPKPVGEIVAVGGSKKLNGGGTRLSMGAKLTLGEHLVMGKGLKATLQLMKPKGAGDRDLVDLSPAKGAKVDVRVSRNGSKITVTITPA
jgi:hypothetical protein